MGGELIAWLTKYLPPCEGGGIKKKCINIVGMGKKMLLCKS